MALYSYRYCAMVFLFPSPRSPYLSRRGEMASVGAVQLLCVGFYDRVCVSKNRKTISDPIQISTETRVVFSDFYG